MSIISNRSSKDLPFNKFLSIPIKPSSVKPPTTGEHKVMTIITLSSFSIVMK